MYLNLEKFFLSTDKKSIVTTSTNGCRQKLLLDDNMNIFLDEFGNGVSCCFIRASGKEKFSLSIEIDVTCCEQVAAGGWLLSSIRAAQEPMYWIPQLPTLRKTDSCGRILSERFAPVNLMECQTKKSTITIAIPDDEVLDIVAWRFGSDNHNLINEIRGVNSIETQEWFLWGSHSRYTIPSDIYIHLIHGHIYENRYSWPNYRKIFSENDAHALYVALTGLKQCTGKHLYSFFLKQLVLSVMHRQDASGAWRHGEWSAELECHTRLHCSGMHLLMDCLTERYDEDVEKALSLAANFISKQHDRVAGDIWFLHDELESSLEGMKKTFFQCTYSKVMGKSKSNMIVLNTHLDTTIALGRYHLITDNSEYIKIVKSAKKSAKKIVELKPFTLLYTILFFPIKLTLMPTKFARELPLFLRALKRLGWKYILPNWAKIKTFFPRIVMPSGFIERHLSIKGLADDYHSINLMDLARFCNLFHDNSYVETIEKGFSFGFDINIMDRWLESEKKKYALGFWGEALYHWYIHNPSPELIDRISETVFMLHDNKIGLPPSFLGGNLEVTSQRSMELRLIPQNPDLVIVNLSRKERVAMLMINVGHTPCRVEWAVCPTKNIIWQGPSGEEAILTDEFILNARSWLLGKPS